MDKIYGNFILKCPLCNEENMIVQAGAVEKVKELSVEGRGVCGKL